MRGTENERITIREVLGFATKDAAEALRIMELSGRWCLNDRTVRTYGYLVCRADTPTHRLWLIDF